MGIPSYTVIPVSEVRTNLSSLLDKAKKDNYVIITKGGRVQAAIVDINYLTKLQQDLSKIYSKTYIDPKLLPRTREFSNQEIDLWLKEEKHFLS